MTFITITIFTLLLSFMPSISLQYLSFKPILTEKEKNTTIKAFIVITIIELILFSVLFEHHIIDFNLLSIKILMLTYWPPYIAIMAYITRKYIYQSIFVAGLQGIYILTLHTLAIHVAIYFVSPADPLAHILQYLLFHTSLYLLFSPLLLRFFKKIFYTHNTIHVLPFWKYMAWLPITLALYTGMMSLKSTPLGQEFLIPRMIQAVTGVLIGIILYAGLKEMSQQVNIKRKNHLLLLHMKGLSEYTALLQEKQKLMSIFRHDSRHQLQVLSELLQNNQDAIALNFLKSIDNELHKSLIPQWCTNPTINESLKGYFELLMQQQISVTVSLPLPKYLPFETDLSQLLIKLIQNTFLNQKESTPSALTLIANVSPQEITLFLQAHNVCNLVLSDDGLPQNEPYSSFNAALASFANSQQATFHYHQTSHMVSLYLAIPYAT